MLVGKGNPRLAINWKLKNDKGMELVFSFNFYKNLGKIKRKYLKILWSI